MQVLWPGRPILQHRVFDTERASPDIASIASKTDIPLEKVSIARIRDLRLKNCAIAVPSTDSE
ncbi:MAG: hypothetical protein ICV52_04145 [Microcoleus sp. C1-bin4]|nr:hypothetical protein [Microcoleus sp. C1-bin4]